MKTGGVKGANRLRIIGGKWRGRKLDFPDVRDLRPTPDRVRETLFNWIQFDIQGSRCLDLFAGSGALGLEAYSRGAAQVLLVEQNPRVAAHLQGILQQLRAPGESLNCQVRQADGLALIGQKAAQGFDLVFLDPPYDLDVTEACILELERNHWLNNDALLYFEQRKRQKPVSLSANWRLLREKIAGQVVFRLAQYQAMESA